MSRHSHKIRQSPRLDQPSTLLAAHEELIDAEPLSTSDTTAAGMLSWTRHRLRSSWFASAFDGPANNPTWALTLLDLVLPSKNAFSVSQKRPRSCCRGW